MVGLVAFTIQLLVDLIGQACVLCFEDAHRDLIHDRDNILARGLDDSIKDLGLRVLRPSP